MQAGIDWDLTCRPAQDVPAGARARGVKSMPCQRCFGFGGIRFYPPHSEVTYYLFEPFPTISRSLRAVRWHSDGC